MLLWTVLFLMWASHVSSEDPVVNVTDCPKGDNVGAVVDDYIRSGENATCRCVKSVTSQSGRVIWRSTNGTVVATDDGINGIAVLKITAGDALSETYYCYLESGGVEVGGEKYTPKIAYGPLPGSVSTTVSVGGSVAPSTYNLCPGDATNITVRCEISKTEVNPMPFGYVHLIKVGGTDEDITPVTFSNNSVSYIAMADVRPNATGNYAIKCDIRNIIFNDITREQTTDNNIRVLEPPKSPPVLIINARNGAKFTDGQTAIVLENSALQVTCEVTGGSPQVDQVHLECGSKPITETGTSATLNFDATRNITGRACICSAIHVTGCYYLTSNVTLDIVYQPQILNFTANSQTELEHLSRGDQVKFECHAEGSPIPTLTIVRDQNDQTHTVAGPTKANTLLKTIQNIQCEGTDRYYCVVENGIVSDASLPTQKSVDVFVRCSPSLQNPDLQNKEYETDLDQDVTFQLAIIGYPAPNDFTFTIDRGSHQIVVNKTKYTVSYTSDSDLSEPSSSGVITFKLYKIGQDDLVSYRLIIVNGEGSGLVYSFKVVEKEDPIDAIAIGVGVGVALLVVAGIIGVVIYCRIRRSRNKSGAMLGGFLPTRKPPKTLPSNLQEGRQNRQLNLYDRPGAPSRDADYPYKDFSEEQKAKKPRKNSGTPSSHTVRTNKTSRTDTGDADYIQPIDEPNIYDYIVDPGSTRSVASGYYVTPISDPPAAGKETEQHS